MRTFQFEEGREVERREQVGKPQWPDHIRINLRHHKAWDLVHQLLHQLEQDETISVSVLGTLEETEE